VTTSVSEGVAGQGAERGDGPRSSPSPPPSTRTQDSCSHPLGEPLERVATAVDRRFRSPWRSPLVVGGAAFLGLVVVLLAVGWLLVHTPLGEPVRRGDQVISEDLAGGRTPWADDYSDVGTSGANTIPIIVGLCVVTVVLAILGRRRDMLLLPIALTLELSVFLSVNYLVARDRPDVVQLGGEPGTHSFPSGHVAATLVLWGSVAVLLGIGRWRTAYKVLGWVAVMVPVGTVAFSRVYRGMHFTTDVLAGILIGVVALTAAVVATRASWLGSHGTAEVDR
jgi:membrane-associated phospholipid phosphatase